MTPPLREQANNIVHEVHFLPDQVDAIVALCQSYAERRRPSKEAIGKVLEDHTEGTSWKNIVRHGALIDDLHALYNAPQERSWCQHWVWADGMWHLSVKGVVTWCPDFDEFTCCPICGAARP